MTVPMHLSPVHAPVTTFFLTDRTAPPALPLGYKAKRA